MWLMPLHGDRASGRQSRDQAIEVAEQFIRPDEASLIANTQSRHALGCGLPHLGPGIGNARSVRHEQAFVWRRYAIRSFAQAQFLQNLGKDGELRNVTAAHIAGLLDRLQCLPIRGSDH